MTFICVSVCPSHGVCGLWRSEDTCRSWACSSTVRAPGIKLRTLHARRQASLSTEPSHLPSNSRVTFVFFPEQGRKHLAPIPTLTPPFPELPAVLGKININGIPWSHGQPLQAAESSVSSAGLLLLMQTPRKSCKANKSGLREGAEPGP